MAQKRARIAKIRLTRSVWIDQECYRVPIGPGAKPVVLSVGKGKQVSEKDATILVGEGSAEIEEIVETDEAGGITTRSASALVGGKAKGGDTDAGEDGEKDAGGKKGK